MTLNRPGGTRDWWSYPQIDQGPVFCPGLLLSWGKSPAVQVRSFCWIDCRRHAGSHRDGRPSPKGFWRQWMWRLCSGAEGSGQASSPLDPWPPLIHDAHPPDKGHGGIAQRWGTILFVITSVAKILLQGFPFDFRKPSVGIKTITANNFVFSLHLCCNNPCSSQSHGLEHVSDWQGKDRKEQHKRKLSEINISRSLPTTLRKPNKKINLQTHAVHFCASVARFCFESVVSFQLGHLEPPLPIPFCSFFFFFSPCCS